MSLAPLCEPESPCGLMSRPSSRWFSPSVIDICKKKQIPIKEKQFSINEVHEADEVFVTGTFAGIIPVRSVDGNTIGTGTRGPLTEQLQTWYQIDIETMSNNK